MYILIDENQCKGCQICIDQCPKKVFVISCQRNKKGFLLPEVKYDEECNQCLICEYICPDMAITVTENKA